MLNILDKAKERLTHLTEKNGKKYVRLSVKGGGCAGFGYDQSFENDKNEKDILIDNLLLVDQIYETALKSGAVGGKLLGAGGGGFMLLFVPPDKQKKIRDNLSKLVNVPFVFENTGSRIALYQPEGLQII